MSRLNGRPLLATLMRVIGVCLSIMFAYYGIGVSITALDEPWMVVSGIAVAGYGVINLFLLVVTRRAMLKAEETVKWRKVASITNISFPFVFLIISFDNGILSPLEVAGVILVGALSWLIWVAVTANIRLLESM